MNIILYYSRMRNVGSFVVEGGEQANAQVVRQMQQLVVVVGYAHVAERLLGVRCHHVRRQKAAKHSKYTRDASFEKFRHFFKYPF